jgi:hypothetical protein
MLTPDYPQFVSAEPPTDGLTVSAWRGVLQPFENDAAARSILCDIEDQRPLWISAGTIRASATKEQHWAQPLLTGMDVACEVMVCPQADAMPRAYLLSPRFRPYFADTVVHPHPRADHTILHEGQLLPGLCVFSSAELTFRDDINFYTQFLDQLTQYVAKHLIWLRTRRLCRWNGTGVTVLYQPVPGEAIPEQAPSAQWVQMPNGRIRVIDFWSGYWPGKAARAATPHEHLRLIKPNQRCWCGLNKTYGECHRPVELSVLGNQH